MVIQHKIKLLSMEDELKFKNNFDVSSKSGDTSECVINLGIYSEAAAEILNCVAHKLNINDVYTFKNGNIFVKCNNEVVISSSGEICLKFKAIHLDRPPERNRFSIFKNVKKYDCTLEGIEEIVKAIKDKLANDLKKCWLLAPKWRSKKSPVFEYLESGIVIIYEYLKGRNIDDIKAKYDQETLDMFIGKKIEDPFVLPAIETIHNEIAKIVEDRDNDLEKIDKEYIQKSNRDIAEMWTKYNKNRKQIENEAIEKITNLKNQISEMLKMKNIKLEV